jgi:pyrroline-5-carboxylate reductase
MTHATTPLPLAILGAGNLGQAIARGLVDHGGYAPALIHLTRHRLALLESFRKEGFATGQDNRAACRNARILLLAVKPYKVEEVVREIAPALQEDQILISVASSVPIARIREWSGERVPVFRAMPNTAVAIGESLTCTAREEACTGDLAIVNGLFERVGRSVVITEELMNAATVLGACGIAYALRFIRAMVQGGIEIGFDAQTAALIANQTVRGAATLLLSGGNHPEAEIDKVTTPRGCTIAGLNEMEHQGFSSSLIKGITTSFEKID